MDGNKSPENKDDTNDSNTSNIVNKYQKQEYKHMRRREVRAMAGQREKTIKRGGAFGESKDNMKMDESSDSTSYSTPSSDSKEEHSEYECLKYLAPNITGRRVDKWGNTNKKTKLWNNGKRN